MTWYQERIEELDPVIKVMSSVARNLGLIDPREILHCLNADPDAIRAKADLLKDMKSLYENINVDILDDLAKLDSHWQGQAAHKFIFEFMGMRLPQFITKVCDRCNELESALEDVADKIEESQEQIISMIVGIVSIAATAVALPAALPLVGVAVAAFIGGALAIVSGVGSVFIAKHKILTVLDEVTGKPSVGAVSIDRSTTGVTTEETERHRSDGKPPGWQPDPDPNTND